MNGIGVGARSWTLLVSRLLTGDLKRLQFLGSLRLWWDLKAVLFEVECQKVIPTDIY